MTYKHQCTCTETDLAADPCQHSATSEGCYVHDPQLTAAVKAFAAAGRAHELALEAWTAANIARQAATVEMQAAHRRRMAASELAGTCYYCGRPADDISSELVRSCADNEGCARADYDEADDEVAAQ